LSNEKILWVILIWLVIFGVTDNGLVTNACILLVMLAFFIWKSVNRKRYEKGCDAEKLKRIEKIMKEPKGIESSGYEERVRRNLLFISCLALTFTTFDIQINPESRFFGGLQFINLTSEVVYSILLVIVLYEFLNYAFNVKIQFLHWRVRLTGISHDEVRGNEGGMFGSDEALYDHSGKDENSNLYLWMFETKKRRDSIINNIESTSEALKKHIDLSGDNANLNALTQAINTYEKSVTDFSNHLHHIRTDASILRFDQWFKLLIVSQNLRWLFFDLIVPFALSAYAIWSLIEIVSFT